jgi:hypothetical protein
LGSPSRDIPGRDPEQALLLEGGNDMPFIFGKAQKTHKAAWQKCKKEFETTTKEKKPGKKLLGLIPLGTGLESLMDKMQDLKLEGWDAKTKEALRSVRDAYTPIHSEFQRKKNQYLTTLDEAKREEGSAYNTALTKLKAGLEDVAKRVTKPEDLESRYVGKL